MQPQVPKESLDQRLLPFRGDALQFALKLPAVSDGNCLGLSDICPSHATDARMAAP